MLTGADLPELLALYAEAYPENWFDPQVLETGQYVGARVAGELVAVVAGLGVLLRGGADHVALNVRVDSVSALRLYERLGFTPVAEYGEFTLTAWGSAAAGGVVAAGADLA